jgi:hypothetical protein
MKDKWLYQFEVIDKKEVEETELSTDTDGKELKTIKKVLKPIKVKFKLKKPNRKLFDEAELFYGVKLAEGIKAGMLTKPLLAKRYSNDGGSLSNPEKQQYATLYLSLYQKESEFQKLNINIDNLEEEENKKRLNQVLIEMQNITRELQQFELNQISLFDQTAENRARNQTIMWWVLNISYIQKENSEEFEAVFPELTYEQKLLKYDELDEEGNPFWQEGLKKLAYFVSFWYMGKLLSEDDFKKAEDFYKVEATSVKEDPEQKSE